MVAVGQKLYLLRVGKGITQSELCTRSGISQANLSKIEKGKQDPTVSTLLNLCSALEIPPAVLFEEDLRGVPLRFTRASVERIAKGVLDPSTKLSPAEGEIASLFRNLWPGLTRRRLPSKQVYRAWYELKRCIPDEAIRMLGEKIQDEESRRQARAEKDYEKLRSGLGKIWGKAR